MEKDEVKFKEGDVVQLVSGSPSMTVIAVKNNAYTIIHRHFLLQNTHLA